MNETEHIFIVRVHMRHLETDVKRKDGIYKDLGIKTAKNLERLRNKAQSLDFEGNIMSYVIQNVKQTSNYYQIEFEGQSFDLQKSNMSDRWHRYNDVFEFRLCKTALDAWKALRGYYFKLHEQVEKSRGSQPIGDGGWEPTGEDKTDG